MSTSGGGGAGALRVKAKLKAALKNGNFYEAHQMYRTLYFRLGGSGQYVELERLLYDGAVVLFSNGESGSGVDLTKCYVDILKKAKIEPEEKYFERVTRLFSMVPRDSPERDSIVAESIKWSTPEGHKHGHPRMHQMFAHYLWSAKRYPESRHHFLHSSDGAGFGRMMADFHVERGYARETDLFIAGAVLQLVCLKKHIVAAIALDAFAQKHPEITRGPPYAHPLMNFVWLLLVAIEQSQSIAVFSLLVDKYRASLQRDPSYLGYLDRIGQSFFGLPAPQRQRPGGMFSGLFDSFFSVLNDEDDEGEESSGAMMARPSSSSRSSSSTTGATKKKTGSQMATEDLD